MKKIILFSFLLVSILVSSQTVTEQLNYMRTMKFKPNGNHHLEKNIKLDMQHELIFSNFKAYIIQIINRGKNLEKWERIGFYAYIENNGQKTSIVIPKIKAGDLNYSKYLEDYNNLNEKNKQILNLLLASSLLEYTNELN